MCADFTLFYFIFILLRRVNVENLFLYILKSLILPPSRSLFFILMDLRIPFVIQGFEKDLIFRPEIGFHGACLLINLFNLL